MATHRTPDPAHRVRDAERTKRCLLEAALDEFAAKGYAGARVGAIAERAGVNKQLITYYFGGKEGLYRALQANWLEHETALSDPELPLTEVVTNYLRDGLRDPRGVRLLMWRGLSDAAPSGAHPISGTDIAVTRRRQERGEVAADLDPAAFQLAVMGMVIAPLLLPVQVRELFGVEAQTAEFEQRYGEQLRRILAHLTDSRSEGETS
ncbi:TetR family transcriptional regulator [Nocardia beijingensis]|uniref:TetR family transcriptional regulator n=1 Tax=Nocardia beijingensis TaxID=95162 RepID=UPI001894EB33|nr:TetR family transcriptional regulator [Nocardia beijingensis]MBF6078043.1 TetR/AcrR family transcriptional regulator [Nocardia beijingensis]